ncbi:hypothetical protein ANN_18233 [Periplaneta americana]|uniref:Uncharacterized protein n=1 Tax=Periplaneta americana TaxID=6978 RepID=A0ABQ8SPJ3_PERAM|nr:hypothetical protein ANN_18233 [Periplaneta americana]
MNVALKRYTSCITWPDKVVCYLKMGPAIYPQYSEPESRKGSGEDTEIWEDRGGVEKARDILGPTGIGRNGPKPERS